MMHALLIVNWLGLVVHLRFCESSQENIGMGCYLVDPDRDVLSF
jgi:hypothetical protein